MSVAAKGTKAVPPEILEKLLRRGGKAGKRAARVAQLKRVRKAQEIQRQLEVRTVDACCLLVTNMGRSEGI